MDSGSFCTRPWGQARGQPSGQTTDPTGPWNQDKGSPSVQQPHKAASLSPEVPFRNCSRHLGSVLLPHGPGPGRQRGRNTPWAATWDCRGAPLGAQAAQVTPMWRAKSQG